jgi:hypothetical protein
MRNLLILAGLSVAAVAGGVQLRATVKATEARREFIASVSTDDLPLTTSGLFDDAVVLGTVPQSQSDDDYSADFLSNDRGNGDFLQQLQVLGFKVVRVGSAVRRVYRLRHVTPVGKADLLFKDFSA